MVDTMLGIDYVGVWRIPFSSSACLIKMASLWNRIQGKFNQDW